MFGLFVKDNHLKEYGFESKTKHEAIRFVDIVMKVKSISCVTSYTKSTGNKTIGKDFFDFLNYRAQYDHNFYFVREVRKKLKENHCNSVEELPEIALAQLMALETALIISSEGGDVINPFKPTSKQAKNDIDEYFEIAKRIFWEKEKVQVAQAIEREESRRKSREREADLYGKIEFLPSGDLTSEKVRVLKTLTQENIFDLLHDPDFEDEKALEWIFSQADCEILNAIVFLETRSAVEPCLLVTQEDDHKSIRVEMFPIYEVVAKGLNTFRFKQDKFAFTQYTYNHLEVLVDDQKQIQARGKTLIYGVNPQILPYYKKLLVESYN